MTAASWRQPAGLALAGALAAAVAGALVVSGLPYALLFTAGLLFAGAVSRKPLVVFAVALLALAYTPESFSVATFGGFLARPELPKALLYASLVPLVVIRGIDLKLTLPVIAYLGLATVAVIAGHLSPALDVQQMASTFVTLSIGWVALAVRWDWAQDWRLLAAVAVIPSASLLFGAVTDVTGLHGMWQEPTAFDDTRRLRGASIAAQLGMLGVVGAAAAYVCWRLQRWRPGPYLLAVNAVILGLTVTRGAAAAFAAAAAIPALKFALGPLLYDRRKAMIRFGALAAAAAAAVATALPALQNRNSGGRYYAGQGTIEDPSSGRTEAWKQTYEVAMQSPLFGHGLGAGPVTKIQEQGFLAQHNEYLRLLLEGGYVGGGIVLAAIVVAVGICISRAPASIRLDLAGLALAAAGFSYVDNTLTSVTFALPFCLIMALCAAPTARFAPGLRR